MNCVPQTVFIVTAMIIMIAGIAYALIVGDNVSYYGQLSTACSNMCCILSSSLFILLFCSNKYVAWTITVFCILSWIGTLGRINVPPIVKIN